MSIYTDEFLENLPEDPKIGIYRICMRLKEIKPLTSNECLEFYALAETYISENNLKIDVPPLPKDPQYVHVVIKNFADKISTDLKKYVLTMSDQTKLEGFKKKFSAQLSNAFVYEFTDGDLKRIQELINELREMLSTSELFEDSHKRRLLKRLEKLQSELHKKVSDLDHFWGLVIDAGVALKKFGNDAKPIIDRMKEISNIAWRTQERAEELPSGSEPPALLPSDEDD